MIHQLVYALSRLLRLKERSKPFRFLGHFFQLTGFPLHTGVHFQRFCDRCLLLEAVGHLFRIGIELRFGFLYRGVYSVFVGLEDVTLEFAG